MSASILSEALDGFRHSAQRLETLPRYSDEGETELRSLRSNRYLARVARAALAGKTWTRVRVVDDPLTGYQREQLARTYVEAHACGEDVLVVDRARVPDDASDVWLFDAGRADARAVRLYFDPRGVPLSDRAELVTDPDELDRITRDLRELAALGTPLGTYLEAPAVGGAAAIDQLRESARHPRHG